MPIECQASCGSHASDCANDDCAACPSCIVPDGTICSLYGPADSHDRANCMKWCGDGMAEHCNLCACQACDVCGHVEAFKREATRGCEGGWCDPAFPEGHCHNSACKDCAFCAARSAQSSAGTDAHTVLSCKDWCDGEYFRIGTFARCFSLLTSARSNLNSRS